MAQWINLDWNNRSIVVHLYFCCEKNWVYPFAASEYYGRLAADELRVDFKILYRLNYWDFHFA